MFSIIKKRPWSSFKVLEKKPDYWTKEVVIDEMFSKQLMQTEESYCTFLYSSVSINLNKKRFRPRQRILCSHQKAVHGVKNVGKSKAKIIKFAFSEVNEGDIVRIEDYSGIAKGLLRVD